MAVVIGRKVLLVVLVAVLLLAPNAQQRAAQAEQFGPDDFRISFSGSDEADLTSAQQPAVAFNPEAHEFFVVWSAITTTTTLTTTTTREEIVGQRIQAETGEPRGAPVIISRPDPNPLQRYVSQLPAVVYNATDRRYLVIWNRTLSTSTGSTQTTLGRFVDATTGAPLGIDGFSLQAWTPAVSPFGLTDEDRLALAFSPVAHKYVLVGLGTTAKYGVRVYAQFLNPDGRRTGAVIEFSAPLPNGADSDGDTSPAVAYNPVTDEVLVTWLATTTSYLYERGPAFVYGQRISVTTQEKLGTPVLIADVAPQQPLGQEAVELSATPTPAADQAIMAIPRRTRPGLPVVAYQGQTDSYLVAWIEGEEYSDNQGPIWARWLRPDTTPLGTAFAVRMPAECVAQRLALGPSASTATTALVWSMGSGRSGTACGRGMQVWADWVRGPQPGGLEAPEQLSQMGPIGGTRYRTTWPAVAIGASPAEVLVVWSGNEEAPGLHPNKHEIFGQLASGLTARMALPALQRDFRPQFNGSIEVEPNNTTADANRPLVSGQAVAGYLNDSRDYFSFSTTRAGTISVDFSGGLGSGTQVQLLDQSLVLVDYRWSAPYRFDKPNLAAGTYYIYIVTEGAANTTTPYSLRVTFP